MKYITFAGSGMLVCLANLLEQLGYDTDAQTIALEMETPYLLLHEDGMYKAGVRLYDLQHMNMYLHTHGFHMDQKVLPQRDVFSFLRSHKPVMLSIEVQKHVHHPVVFSGYENGRFQFVNIMQKNTPEPETMSFSHDMLKRRLPEAVTVYTLCTCPPSSSDYQMLLLRSLDTLESYLNDVLAARELCVTPSEYRKLQDTLFRPLMQDLLPLTALTGDEILFEELRLLNHDYRHVFIWPDQTSAALYEHLPKNSIRQCIGWLRENIIDRLYALGADEATMEALMNAKRR